MEAQLANLQAWVESAARYKQQQQQQKETQPQQQQQQQQKVSQASKPLAAQSVTSVISEGSYSAKSSECLLLYNVGKLRGRCCAWTKYRGLAT